MNKTLKITFGVFAAIILLTGSFAGGFLTRHALSNSGIFPGFNDTQLPVAVPTDLSPSQNENSATPAGTQDLFVPFWEAWNVVHQKFVNQPVDDKTLMEGAIRGMLAALSDKQTFYMDPTVYQSETSSLAGEYEGIGAYVDTKGDYLTIVKAIDGSPAEAAGLQPGDQIIAIDNLDMTGFTAEEARQKVLGPEGTQVDLTVKREGQSEPLHIVVTRARIDVPSVTGKMLDNGIAYIDINTFGDKTTQEMQSTLNDLLAQNPKGIILDLRFNPGGYLTSAVDVLSEFIDHGVVVIEQYGDGTRDTYSAHGNGKATDLPIVVLINEGSASASEIVAGALQDYGRAKLVGVQSYGKGSVQIWQPLSNNEGAARITVAKWLTPKERAIDGVGLTPDYVVEMTDADYANNRDPQMDKAVEVMKGLIANQ